MLRIPSRAAAVLALLALVSACGSETPDPLAEACRDVACGPGRCVLTADGPACLCDAGHHADGLACVADPPPPDPDPCEPNPCTEPHRTVCTVEDSAARCGCDAGYVWRDGSCVELTRPTCATEPWPGGDRFEPDDCPERALTDFPMGRPQEGRTLAPAGDVDWYRLPVRAGYTYRVQAEGADGVPLYLDVLTSEGLQPLGADHRGGTKVDVSFKAASAAPVMVRLSTLELSATSPYTLTLTEERQDDFADTAEGATELRAGGVVVSGGMQFHGDVDVHVLPLEAGTSALVDGRSSPGTPVALRLELVSPDGATVLRQAQGLEARLPVRVTTTGRYLLRVRTVDPMATADYRLSFRRLGADDHGDDAEGATALPAPPTTRNGAFERSLDVDAFTFIPVPGHQYRLNCGLRTGAFWCHHLLFRQGEQPTGFWDFDALEHKAVDATPLVWLVRSDSGASGTYALTLQDLGPDDHADTAADATPITVGGPAVTGTVALEADVDTLAFTAQARHVYRVQCGGPGSWISVQAWTPAGQPLGQAAVSEPLRFLAPMEGRYTLTVRTYLGSAAGDWSCQLTDGGTDDHGNTLQDATPLRDSEGSGNLQYGDDIDVYSAPTVAGRLYRVTLTPGTSRSLGLAVLTSSGAVQASFSASSTPSAAVFKALTPTTLFSVLGFSTFSVGTYSLRLEDAGMDDHGDTPGTATALTLPGALVGTLQFASDVDVFSFAVTAGSIYRVSCTGTGSDWIQLAAREGAEVTPVAYGTRTLLYRVATSGTLSVAVSNGLMAYSCAAEDVGTDDHPDTATGALELSVPASGTGVLETSQDVDAFVFRPTAGRIYRATCSQRACGLRVRGPDGQVLAERTFGGSVDAALAWEAGPQAWVTLEVFFNTMLGAYGYTLEELGMEDDHGDTSLTATALDAGTVRLGAMFESYRDVDTFTFPATAGHIYRVRCVRATATLCSVKVKDPTGREVQASHEAVVSGRYLIEASSDGEETGTYTLHVEALGPDDHADTTEGATPLPAGTPREGRLETFNDVDVFALSVTAPRAYRVTCGPDPVLSSCAVSVRTASGTLVASTSTFSYEVSFEAPATGTLFVQVSTNSYQSVGTYTLLLEDLGLDDVGDTAATAAPLSLSEAVPGRFETATDVDVYAVRLTGGQRYWVDVNSSAGYQLGVTDANGTVLPFDFARVVQPSTTGTYYLHLTALHAGTYQVRMQSGF